MALSEGTTLGPNEVAGLIGQGEVYRARDTKLDWTGQSMEEE